MIDLRPVDLARVEAILQRRIPGREVVVFGSRVNGRAQPFSDLDLAVLGEPALSWKERADLIEDFVESDLPIRVDVIDINTVEPAFREIVLARCETIQPAA